MMSLYYCQISQRQRDYQNIKFCFINLFSQLSNLISVLTAQALSAHLYFTRSQEKAQGHLYYRTLKKIALQVRLVPLNWIAVLESLVNNL